MIDTRGANKGEYITNTPQCDFCDNTKNTVVLHTLQKDLEENHILVCPDCLHKIDPLTWIPCGCGG